MEKSDKGIIRRVEKWPCQKERGIHHVGHKKPAGS
jgi:hypothetical protein